VELEDGIIFSGILGFCRIRNGEMVQGYLIGGTRLEYRGKSIDMKEPRITGKIIDFDREYSNHNRIYIDVKVDRSVIGEWIRIFNDGKTDACYEIKDIGFDEKGMWLDIGDITFIRGFKDPIDYNKGFVYNFAVDDNFEIVLSEYIDQCLKGVMLCW
jgi:hypothetical protein